MENGMTHAVVGGLSGIGITLMGEDENRNKTHDLIVATGVDTLFGKLADILEPALNNPHHDHRQFFHSLGCWVWFSRSLMRQVRRIFDKKPKQD